MRFIIPILFAIVLGGCLVKPVETVYHEENDLTSFTTKSFKTNKKGKEISLFAIKECQGKVICSDNEIKLKIIHRDRFSFLKGKDLILETDEGDIDLNERDFSNTYNARAIAKDGTTGVLTEEFLIWISESNFRKAAHSQNSNLFVGDYSFNLSTEGREAWKILLDKELILNIMDDEKRREYGLYPHENKKRKEQDIREKRINSEAAESTWELVKDSKNTDDLRYFLEKFPNSPYAIPAKLKIKQIERGTE